MSLVLDAIELLTQRKENLEYSLQGLDESEQEFEDYNNEITFLDRVMSELYEWR